jgi:hypothetical protein
MSIDYNEIKKIDFKKLLEVNLGFEVQSQKEEHLSYITVDNFFKNPNDIVDVLKLFPVNNKDLFYEKVKEMDKEKYTKPSGIQQLFPSSYFESISFVLYKLLAEYDYVPYDIENSGDYLLLGKQLNQFIYYSNIYYPGMLKENNNNYPHFDQFNFAFNIFLSENVGGGTAFYKLKHNGKTYGSIDAIVSEEDYDTKVEIQQKLNDMNNTDETAPYDYFEGNDLFEKFHVIDYEFNKLTLYKGNNWHGVYYDSLNETNTRYSLSAAYTPILDN